jgi:hypothetical protein
MDERIQKWLYDILIAIEEIESFFVSIPNDFNFYFKNLILNEQLKEI